MAGLLRRAATRNGHQTQTQISYEDQIADLRAQIDRVSRLDQERVEQ
jgi:hypothetical protein